MQHVFHDCIDDIKTAEWMDSDAGFPCDEVHTEESPALEAHNDVLPQMDTNENSPLQQMLQLLMASMVPDIKRFMLERFTMDNLAFERRISSEERHRIAIMAVEERRLTNEECHRAAMMANEERHRAAMMAIEEMCAENEEKHRMVIRAAKERDTVMEQQHQIVTRAGEEQRQADERSARAANVADEQADRKWSLLRRIGSTLPEEEMQRQIFHLLDTKPTHRRISKFANDQPVPTM